jgi:hypothetical protein
MVEIINKPHCIHVQNELRMMQKKLRLIFETELGTRVIYAEQ